MEGRSQGQPPTLKGTAAPAVDRVLTDGDVGRALARDGEHQNPAIDLVVTKDVEHVPHQVELDVLLLEVEPRGFDVDTAQAVDLGLLEVEVDADRATAAVYFKVVQRQGGQVGDLVLPVTWGGSSA